MVRIFLLIILFLSGEFISTLFAMNHANSSDSLTMSFEEPEGEASSNLTKRIKKRLKSAQNKYMEALHVFIFKVGQGNFCMIKKGKNVIVVDAGSYSMQNSEVFNFEEIKDIFLLCLSNAKIKAVIITHADVDHYNFLKSLEQFFDPDCFFILGGIKNIKMKF